MSLHLMAVKEEILTKINLPGPTTLKVMEHYNLLVEMASVVDLVVGLLYILALKTTSQEHMRPLVVLDWATISQREALDLCISETQG